METLQQIGAVMLVLALALAAVRKLGRRPSSPSSWMDAFSRARKTAFLRSEERLRLTPQHSLHAVSAGHKTLLIGCHAGGMTVLADLTPEGSAGAESDDAQVRRRAA